MKDEIPYREETIIVNGNIEVTVKGKFVEIEIEAEILDTPPIDEIIDYPEKEDSW